ncbi:hypothetical protein [Desulfosoma caldarium]|uniref:Uncharacterized protein n=1 Tax=Desulfosoma caldarium TaxID=610254 RepID=A0A3N1UHS8_9BACT|nr:hypothetical protein [Desulfosoma caldarium]ROQ90825.1 hypothetical protein EDC27_2080 [Desulfosoma caldarium]
MDQGRMYLPCPLDPQIVEELQGFEPLSAEAEGLSGLEVKPRILLREGTAYVETVSWQDVVRHASELFPHMAQKRRKTWFRDLSSAQRPRLLRFGLKPVEMVLFEVLPRFVRVPLKIKAAQNRRAALAAWLADKVRVPTRYVRGVEEMEASPRFVEAPEMPAADRVFQSKGVQRVTRRDLLEAVETALIGKAREAVLAEESWIRETLDGFASWPKLGRALMLYVLTRGALEVNGFGFFHRPFDGALVVYKRTGRYALMDYYQRLYLFPDCRVAVSSVDLWPVVVEKYKHPLLARYQPWQRICLGHAPRGRTFNARDIFRSIEDGLNALYHGYDARKRNGYHSLEGLSAIEREINFDDLRVSAQDARRLSENIPVTNAWT